jgi:TldD protein
VTADYFAENFGVDQSVLRKTIARGMAKGGDYAEVFLQHRVGDAVSFEDEKVNRASVSVDLGAGLRVLNGDQTGYAFTEDLSLPSLLAAAETAASIATGPSTAGPDDFTPVEVPELYPRQRIWADVPPEPKVKIARQVGRQVLGGDPSVINATVNLTSDDEVLLVANSLGQIVVDTRPMSRIAVGCVAERDGRRESNYYLRGGRWGIEYYSDDQLVHLARETVDRTLWLFDAASPPAGELPVVLAPGRSGILLHEAMGHGFEADFNRKGTSIFSRMMGQMVAEPSVTILDTALQPGARGAINVDDEGTPGKRTVLVDRGRLVSYLHDRISARHFGVEPTGNGRRQSFRYAPLPRMRITTMANGPHDPDEIIRSVKRGLYAVDFSNGQVTIGAGDYSFYLKTGYLIEDGKLTRPIKDANLIGNGPDTLKKIVMVGNDCRVEADGGTCGKDGQWVPVSMGMPTVKVTSITVGGVG